jgi:hypothetical protein
MMATVIAVLLTAGCTSSGNSKSIEISGYNFTLADADDWLMDQTIENAEDVRWSAGTYGDFDVAPMVNNMWIGWHGKEMPNAFYLPDKDAVIAIYVLDKIPSELNENSPLEEAALLSNSYLFKDLLMDKEVSTENVTFNEFPAHLVQEKGMAAIAVQLSPEKIAVIDVNYHDGDPWDTMEKITIKKIQ